MKYLIITLSILLLSIPEAFAVKFYRIEPAVLQKNTTGNYVYEKIVPIEGKNKDELYNSVKRWIQANVKTVDNNISFDDKNMESIVTTPTLALANSKKNWIIDQSINFKLVIDFKDNKIRISASSFIYYGLNDNAYPKKIFTGPIESFETGKSYIEVITPNVDSALKAFFDGLEKSATTKKDNW